MKKLLAILLVALIIFTGCETPDVSDGVSSDVSEPTPEISPEDLALAEKAASFLGAIHNAGVWDNADEIGVHHFYLWYIDYIASTTTYEERLERYNHENYEVGWSYPQEEFEAFMQRYFDVSIEHLRSDEYCYHAEDGIYNLDYLGAPNMRYEVQLAKESLTVDGDKIYIPIELSMDGFTEHRTLVIQKTEDGFKYLESRFTTEKVDFVGFSMLVPKDMRVENFTIFITQNSNAEFIKLLDVQTGSGFAELLSNAEKEYGQNEYLVSKSDYVDENLMWKEYTLKIPLPEESGLDMTETYSYYLILAGDRAILMQTTPLIYGSGSYRDEIEKILKTIKYTSLE